MGNSTVSMAIFNSMLVYQRVNDTTITPIRMILIKPLKKPRGAEQQKTAAWFESR